LRLAPPWGFSRLALRGTGQGAARPCTPCLLFFGRFASRLRGCGAPRRCPALANVAEGFLAAGAARGRAGRCTPLHPVPTLSGKSRQKARHATSGQNPRMAPLCAGAADCPRCAGSGQIEVSWLARRAGRLRPFSRLATPGVCPPFANAAPCLPEGGRGMGVGCCGDRVRLRHMRNNRVDGLRQNQWIVCGKRRTGRKRSLTAPGRSTAGWKGRRTCRSCLR